MKNKNLQTRNVFKLAFFMLALVVGLNSCKKDDTFQAPKVTAPDNQTIEAGAAADLTFSFNAEGGFKSATVSAVNGTASITTDGTADAENGNITVAFTAGNTPGAASVKLTVTDNEDQSDDATAVLNITLENLVIVTSNISENTTWTSDKVYRLAGRITVLDGATLTIEPGTIIKGEAGTGPNATALLVARGGKLIADGTADAPIIFTSVADELSPEDIAAGNFGSPNLDPDIDGLWGGVLILGRARISASNENGDVSEVQIEGIPTSDPNGLYGGNVDTDDSGILRYISIRHGGSNIGGGNEINGLTLGGVGSETIIENVEIVSNQDDGIEWFGGTVDVKNAVVWNVNDDAIDTDQSWAGTLDNFVIIAPGDHNFELDGPEGSYPAGHTIKNGYVIANDFVLERNSADLINTDDNSIVNLENIFITSIREGQKINRVVHNVGVVNFSGIVLNVPAENLGDYVNGDVPTGVTAGTTHTANLSVFGWTWAAQAGKIPTE